MKIYTKTGDRGTTQLIGGRRVSKNHPRIEAYGTVDELMAQVAYLRDNLPTDKEEINEFHQDLLRILDDLMRLSSYLAAEDSAAKKLPAFDASHVQFLEGRIDAIQATLVPITRFTLPGGHPLVSLANIARTVCRRCERRIIDLQESCEINPYVGEYINRLSDYFYVAGRKFTDEFHVKEILWEYNS